MVLSERRTGFIETLEVTLASLLFFIFLITVLPSFIGGNSAEAVNRAQVIDTLEALEADEQLRADVMDRDLDALSNTVSPYFSQQEVAIGLAWANVTQGTADRSIRLPEPTDRVLVRAWNRDASPSLSINGTTVFDGSTPQGHVSEDMTSQLGSNTTVPLSVSGDLRYSIEVYSSDRDRSLPSGDTAVQGYGYVFGGGNSTMQPAELRVYIW